MWFIFSLHSFVAHFIGFDLVDDDEEYEENGQGNRLLGFMFGNVDNSGDLDVDYLDEVFLHPWTTLNI